MKKIGVTRQRELIWSHVAKQDSSSILRTEYFFLTDFLGEESD